MKVLLYPNQPLFVRDCNFLPSHSGLWNPVLGIFYGLPSSRKIRSMIPTRKKLLLCHCWNSLHLMRFLWFLQRTDRNWHGMLSHLYWKALAKHQKFYQHFIYCRNYGFWQRSKLLDLWSLEVKAPLSHLDEKRWLRDAILQAKSHSMQVKAIPALKWLPTRTYIPHLAIFPPVFPLQLGGTGLKLWGTCLQRVCAVVELRQLLVPLQHLVHVHPHDIHHLRRTDTPETLFTPWNVTPHPKPSLLPPWCVMASPGHCLKIPACGNTHSELRWAQMPLKVENKDTSWNSTVSSIKVFDFFVIDPKTWWISQYHSLTSLRTSHYFPRTFSIFLTWTREIS